MSNDSSKGTLHFRAEGRNEDAVLGEDEQLPVGAEVEVRTGMRLVVVRGVGEKNDATDERAVLVPDLRDERSVRCSTEMTGKFTSTPSTQPE
jgi:hypothetical protein